MTIPLRAVLAPFDFLEPGRTVLNRLDRVADDVSNVVRDEELRSAIEALEDSYEKVQPPLHRLEHGLHPRVTFSIRPVFALANAGVVFEDRAASSRSEAVVLGVILWLLCGKSIGVCLGSWLPVRAKLASLLGGLNWRHIHVAGWLGGIGFTMSRFVAGVAFDNEEMLRFSKLGILAGSTLAGIVGSILLLRSRPVTKVGGSRPGSPGSTARARRHFHTPRNIRDSPRRLSLEER